MMALPPNQKKPTIMDEVSLVRRVALDDQIAFDILYARIKNNLWNIAWNYSCRNMHAAQDLNQKALLKVWLALKKGTVKVIVKGRISKKLKTGKRINKKGKVVIFKKGTWKAIKKWKNLQKRIWKPHPSCWRPNGSLDGWLYKVAKYSCLEEIIRSGTVPVEDSCSLFGVKQKVSDSEDVTESDPLDADGEEDVAESDLGENDDFCVHLITRGNGHQSGNVRGKCTSQKEAKRKKGLLITYTENPAENQPDKNTPPPYDNVEKEDYDRILQRLLSSLPPDQKQALMLKYTLRYSQKEIAVIQNDTPDTVNMRIHRAKTNLLKLFREFHHQSPKEAEDLLDAFDLNSFFKLLQELPVTGKPLLKGHDPVKDSPDLLHYTK
jgi:RNA polymerase sigma factor (sigma-70 family)